MRFGKNTKFRLVERRSVEGGVRFGEMEKDALLAHGLAYQIKEMFYEKSDAYDCYFCELCGFVCAGNAEKAIFECKNCRNTKFIANVKIPWTSTLLVNELRSKGIAVRFELEDDVL